nr:HalOD1 output domain-containing protein [Halogranum gelatinilyticum]
MSSHPDRTLAPSRSLCEFESIEYHAEEDICQAQFSTTDEVASMAVVSAVAAASDTDSLDMDPLYESVDIEALDSLVTPRRAVVGDLHLTFEYQGYEVTASSCGSIKVKPLHASTSSAAEDD